MLARIEHEHLDDPQVAAALYRLLYETGVIPPDDAGAQPPAHEEMPTGRGRQRAPSRRRPHLDARQRSSVGRQIHPLDAVVMRRNAHLVTSHAPNDDDRFMGRALALAVRGEGLRRAQSAWSAA